MSAKDPPDDVERQSLLVSRDELEKCLSTMQAEQAKRDLLIAMVMDHLKIDSNKETAGLLDGSGVEISELSTDKLETLLLLLGDEGDERFVKQNELDEIREGMANMRSKLIDFMQAMTDVASRTTPTTQVSSHTFQQTFQMNGTNNASRQMAKPATTIARGAGEETNKTVSDMSLDVRGDGGSRPSCVLTEYINKISALSTEDEEKVYSLPGDTYGFLICSRIMSRAWWFGMVITTIQLVLFALFLYNILVHFEVPADVEASVRVAQVFAIVIAVFIQDDLRTALDLAMHRVYHLSFTASNNDAKNQIQQGSKQTQEETATERTFVERVKPSKWYFSATIRGVEGLLSLVVSFVLIVQSSNVFDLILNFTAVLFVSELDELTYYLSKSGYFGKMVSKEAHRVENLCYFYSDDDKKISHRNFYRSAILVSMLVILYVCFGVISVQQDSGAKLTCPKDGIYVTFGDAVVPVLGVFTGTYNLVKDDKLSSRVVYENDAISTAKFGYCQDETRWTFFYKESNSDLKPEDPCEYMIAKSAQTSSFDIMDSASDGWYTADGVPLEQVQFLCEDTKTEACPTNGDASDWCPSLSLPPDRWLTINSARTFNALGNQTRSHGRPIYWGKSNVGDSQHKLDLLLFSGRRWIATDTDKLNLTDMSDVISFFQPGKFHASDLPTDAVTYMSDALDVSTKACAPIGVTWYPATQSDSIVFPSPDLLRPLEKTILACSNCNYYDSNPCQFEGICEADGTCNCTNSGAEGALCQLPPLNDGICNSYFNTKAFQFDGGDCCGPSCNSPLCGITTSESAFGAKLKYFGDGFPTCLDNTMRPITIVVDNNGSCCSDSDGWEASIQLDCDGKTILRVPVGTRMEYGTNETVFVQDGSQCTFTMTPAGFLNGTVRIHREAIGGGEFEILRSSSTFFDPTISASRVINEDFEILSPCLMEAIFNSSQTATSEQSSAASWVDRFPLDTVEGFGCQDQLTMQRYALAVLNYATNDILQTERRWLKQAFYCNDWQGVACNQDFRVQQLSLERYNIMGTLPTEMAYLVNLQTLLISKNSLHGTIPSQLGRLTALETLLMDGNNLNGTIPTEIAALTALEDLWLAGNDLTGTLPTEMGTMTGLSYLDMGHNNLVGTLPSEIGMLTQLTYLSLPNNNFTGIVPSELTRLLESLTECNLFGNPNLSGIPPNCKQGVTEWAIVAQQTNRVTDTVITDAEFRALLTSSPNKIVRRECFDCFDDRHKDVYYKRFTPLPSTAQFVDTTPVSFLDIFLNNWYDYPSNGFNVDFALYSSYDDALTGSRPWMFCNFNDPGVGFARDCGPTGPIGYAWNTYDPEYNGNGPWALNTTFSVEVAEDVLQ